MASGWVKDDGSEPRKKLVEMEDEERGKTLMEMSTIERADLVIKHLKMIREAGGGPSDLVMLMCVQLEGYTTGMLKAITMTGGMQPRYYEMLVHTLNVLSTHFEEERIKLIASNEEEETKYTKANEDLQTMIKSALEFEDDDEEEA